MFKGRRKEEDDQHMEAMTSNNLLININALVHATTIGEAVAFVQSCWTYSQEYYDTRLIYTEVFTK